MLEKLKKVFYRGMTNNDISYKSAMQMMEKNKEVVLVDVRSKQEYEEGHLNGSILLSLYDIDKTAKKVLPNTLAPIIVYCMTSTRSKKAKEKLEAMGYENVYNLKGGLNDLD